MTYDCDLIFEKLDVRAFLPALDRASSALIRFDERLRSDPLSEGLRQRMDFAETIAITREEGDLVHLEDLVLLDARLSSGHGDLPLSRALVTLSARRRASAGTPLAALSDDGLAAIGGVLTEPAAPCTDVPSQLLAPDEHAFARLKSWRTRLRSLEALPPLLAAAVAFEDWVRTPPLLRNAAMGAVLISCYLRARGIVQHHLPPLTIGIRVTNFRPLTLRSQTARLTGFMGAVAATAEHGMKELARLTNARNIMALKLKGRRKSSNLPALANLLLSRPLITIPMAAKAIGISQQAVAALIPQLGATPRELTERHSYRAWGIL